MFENWPYADLHNLNLDWIINIAKNFLDQYTQIQQIISQGLEDLDAKAAELQQLLDTWYDTHSQDIANQLADALSDLNTWYTQHVGYLDQAVIDNLALFNQQAEQAIQEMLITIPADYTELYNDVFDNNSINNFVASGTGSTTWNGITFQWNGEICNVSGTATADSYINVYSDSNALPGGIAPGDMVTLHMKSTDPGIGATLFEYYNGGWQGYGTAYKTRQWIIDDSATGMLIRIFVANGTTVNGSIRLRLSNVQTDQQTGQALPFILPDTGIECKAYIEHALAKYGLAILGKGVYLTQGITMPNNTTIRGAGRASILRNFTSGQNGIICGAGCTIEDLEIDGLLNAYPTVEGANYGISITGTHDTPPFKYNTKINNVTIHGFAGAGIYARETGTWVANSMSITNCEIYFCWAGISFKEYAEFNRVTNVMCRDNYIAVWNLGGNNVFVNCSFSNNFVGFYLPDSPYNSAHGALIGCTLNHSNNNNGYGVIMRNVTNGFIFEACHIWYSKIISTGCSGIAFNNCMFGGGTPDIEHWDNPLFVMNGCTFKQTPNIHGGHTEGNQDNFIMNNCYGFDGSVITA